jgi:N-acetylgalactosamine-N,N'-diacetylbacillosaminyl-diphospho-undecaprenol 4-alpha-N-acetylgalactosaminyltransferase
LIIKKKVAIVVKHLAEGGAQQSSARLSYILDDLNFEVSIIALYNNRVCSFKGKYYDLSSGGKSGLGKFGSFLKFRKIIRENEFDWIIDFRGRYSFTREFLINKLVYQDPRKVVFTVRESVLGNYFPKPFSLFRRFYRSSHSIIAQTSDIKQRINKEYNLRNVTVIPNTYNFKEIVEKSKESLNLDNKFILAVGRLAEVKQFDKLIKAYSKTKLPKEGFKLLIMGDGEERGVLSKQIKELDLEERVELISFQENPYKYMAKAELLILCSKNEGFPNVLVEALACGTPVITFEGNGANEIVKHEENGLLVENQNFENLKTTIERLVFDDHLRHHCQQNSKSSIEHLSYDGISPLWQQLLSD